MYMQGEHHCEHFRNLKIAKTLQLGQETCCKYCLIGKNYIWLCLAKSCGALLCDRNNKQHIRMHLEQSKSKKAFHSIYINILTAQIICIHCDKQIYDLDSVKSNMNAQPSTDPFALRVKILPALLDFESQKNKIMGQLENSQGHKKISKSLTGFFSDKRNHAINSALQFLMQFELFRDIVLTIKPLNKEIQQLAKLFSQAEEADFRAIQTNELTKILLQEITDINGYRRKDPFEFVLYYMTKVHEQIKYYSLQYKDVDYDEWDLLGSSGSSSKVHLNCPLFDNTSLTLSLNYSCKKCQREQSLPAHVNFLKLAFPKKKRRVKQVQKQLAEYKIQSPVKHRRKSLANLFKKDQQCPITVSELIIQFLKHPFHKDKVCIICKEPMRKNTIHFQELPQYLIIQINRMGADGNSVDQTKIQFNSDILNLGSFTSDKNEVVNYQLECALCIENTCSYPVIARSRFNKQMYLFKHQLVSMLRSEKNLPNPYIICYKKVRSPHQVNKIKDNYNNIKSNVEIELGKEKLLLSLPDFWLCQLKNCIVKPLNNQIVCKHNRLKPSIKMKMKAEQRVPSEVYQYLTQTYGGTIYKDVQCEECLYENEKLKDRKKLEKDTINQYEKLKTTNNCMISSQWIKKWTNFLYAKSSPGYFSKGYPFPGPIDNKVLLDGQKCRSDLQKNQDYKVITIYIWKFLKEIYGGGPQIRYKWNKNEPTTLQEQKIKQIRQVAKQVRESYIINIAESPKKSSTIIQKTTSFVESVRGSEEMSEGDHNEQYS